MQNFTFKCKAPEGETPKAYKVRNDKGTISYLAKSQMSNVSISGDVMTFTSTDWFHGVHPWLVKVNNTSDTQNV